MALARCIGQASKTRQIPHDESTCLVSSFSDAQGNRYLQLDTYGSSNRRNPSRISQSLQLDRNAAMQLRQEIDRVFGTSASAEASVASST